MTPNWNEWEPDEDGPVLQDGRFWVAIGLLLVIGLIALGLAGLEYTVSQVAVPLTAACAVD